MVTDNIYSQTKTGWFVKVKDYTALMKLRLSFLVVISAIAGYLLSFGDMNWMHLALLVIGGFFVTGASNAFNQIIERQLDAKMTRTAKRPVASGRLSVLESVFVASIMAIVGLSFLLTLNFLSFVLGVLAMFTYVVLYTPLKQITPFAVFVGAVSGAIPPMLGWVASTGKFGIEPGILFAVQFMWQFPHFWAIAWVLDDDYKKAGFRLLPTKSGRSKSSAWKILLYTVFTIPAGMLPWIFNISGLIALIVTLLCGAIFSYFAVVLFLTCKLTCASKLMYASFLYLPIVLFIQVIDKI